MYANGYAVNTVALPKYPPSRPRCRVRRQFRGGEHVAVKRAFAAAKLYGAGAFTTAREAIETCVTSSDDFAAARVLFAVGDQGAIREVLCGDQSLIAAAKKARKVTSLVRTYRAASLDDLAKLGEIVGIECLFDQVVVPPTNIAA
jgi:hypothetical protein